MEQKYYEIEAKDLNLVLTEIVEEKDTLRWNIAKTKFICKTKIGSKSKVMSKFKSLTHKEVLALVGTIDYTEEII